ncbi:MAG: hypothetical protein ABL958_14510, partial [Bdellovibrionia bacterium]
MNRIAFALLFTLVLSPAVHGAIPSTLTVKAAAIYPEGIAFNQKTSEFYVSSLRKGTIGVISQKGVYSEFAVDENLVSTVGMLVDAPRNRLLACVSDPGVGLKTDPKHKERIAWVVAYDLTTKKKVGGVALGKLKKGKHFCNDLTVDAEGNIYVTDSFSPIIYKIKGYTPTIFVESDKFVGAGFNLNGIVYHSDGYLLVAKYNDGTIWKISIKDPADITQVTLPAAYSGLDGLVLISKNEIAGIQNAKENKIHKFTTTDGWKTATVKT